MKRRFRYDYETGKMVEIIPRSMRAGVMVMPDIAPFVSPIDGKVITGRRALAEHNKRHNVTNAADFKNQWENDAKKRASFFTEGRHDTHERKQQLHEAMTKLQRRR